MLEKDTRQILIDQQLALVGWDVHNPLSVAEEYLLHVERPSHIQESKAVAGFCDYTLLDRSGTPIAIVEAKRTARYALAGKEQASEYAEAIRQKFGREPFIFM